MFLRQVAQRGKRSLPVAARLVRVERGGIHQLAGGIDHRRLDAGTDAGIEADYRVRPGRCRQQQVAQVAGKDADRFFLGALAQLGHELGFEMQRQLHHPGPARGFEQPFVGRTALVADAAMHGHHAGAGRGLGRIAQFGLGFQRQSQDVLIAPAQQGQRPMRGDGRHRLAEVEPVAEFRAFGFLAGDHGGGEQGVLAEVVAQLGQQRRVFAEALHEYLARAVERRLDVRHMLLGRLSLRIDVLCRLGVRAQCRVVEQRLRQRFQPRLAGDLGLGAALLLIGQVKVFEPLLVVRSDDCGFEVRRQLALLGDSRQYRGAAIFQLAQVAEPVFEIAQLGIVKVVGDFLAIARNEGHRGALVEQLHGSSHLLRADGEFFGNAQRNALLEVGGHLRGKAEGARTIAAGGGLGKT